MCSHPKVIVPAYVFGILLHERFITILPLFIYLTFYLYQHGILDGYFMIGL